ncbi:MAG: ribose-phosphate diphosphokinase [Bacillota bacterium]
MKVFGGRCPPVDETFMELLIAADALKRASARRLTAVLPYYPYVRSDKKDQPRVPITARLVADLMVTAGVDRAVTIDLTADQVQGFFSVPLDHLTAQPVFARYLEGKGLEDLVIVAPDPGAVKRAQRFAERLGVPVAFIDKRRTGAKVRVTTVVGDVNERQAVLFDDEVDSGGSACEAADLLHDRGAKAVYLACTHGVLSGEAPQRLAASAIREVIITDSVPVPPKKRWDRLVVLSIAPLLAEAVRRIHTGESISVLFV